MWSLGCILAEMATGFPLFDGDSEIEQLFKIYALTGCPTEAELSSIGKGDTKFKIVVLPKWESLRLSDIFEQSNVTRIFSLMASSPARKSQLIRLLELKHVLGPLGVTLLERLLDLNPETRISAKEALAHPFLSMKSAHSEPANVLHLLR